MSIYDSVLWVGSLVRDRFDLAFGLAVGALVFAWVRRERNLPPGPTGIPVFGYLPFLGKEAYRTLNELSRIYGPVFSFYLGRRLVVVLGSFKVVKEALTNNNIMDRPKNPPNHLMPNSTNMSISNGRIWKEQRQFTVQTLRQLGMGKSAVENLIQAELQRFVSVIDSKGGCPMNLDDLLMSSISNNMFVLLSGEVLDYGHKDRQFLNDLLRTMTLYFRPTRFHAYFPFTRPWMAKFKIWGYDRVEYYMTKLGKFIEDQIEDHRKTLDQLNVRDYVDGYLLAMKGKENTSFSAKMLKGNYQSLLGAGSTPARAAVEWALVSVLLYPEIQEKVHREIDSIIGQYRTPSWADHLQLPYTTAVVYEVLRHHTIVPISMLRCASVRSKIAGYDIPKDTIVMTNIWGVHHDPEFWDDPFEFKPERFLVDGKVVRPPAFMPFSYGKRNCPGEDMAHMEVFLYFTTLMQRYSVSLPNNDRCNLRELLGIAKLVILDNICLKRRDASQTVTVEGGE